MSETTTETVAKEATPRKRRTRRTKAQPAPTPPPPSPPAESAGAVPPVFAAIGQALRLLENGIREADWQMVGEAYAMLSGNTPPRSSRIDPHLLLRDLEQTIHQYLNGRGPQPTTAAPVSHLPSHLPSQVESGDVESVGSLSDDAMLIEESRRLSSQHSSQHRRQGLNRPEFRMVDVTCTRCGKTRPTNPALIPPRVAVDDQATGFICNRCVVGGAR